MSIIGLQRRLREIARIRTGEQVIIGGVARPRALSTFRITSADRAFIEAAAARYGGEPREWRAPSGAQWEVITETSELAVLVPPTDIAFSQAYELWTAGGCQRRCDGARDLISDGPCACDPDARDCVPTTRLSLILHELPGLGVCRLESHGWYAAVELAGAVELVRAAFRDGRLLPARLLLERRQVKRVDEHGRPQARQFVVPCLSFPVSVASLLESAGPSLDRAEPPGLTPVPALPEPVPSLDEQVHAPERSPGSARRRNAAEPIRPTGRRPRTAVEASAAEGHPGGEPVTPALPLGADGDDDIPPPVVASSPPGPSDTDPAPDDAPPRRLSRAQRVAIACRDAGISAGEDRHAFIALVTEGRANSGSELTDEDFARVAQVLGRIRCGELRFVHGITGPRLEETSAVDGDDDPAWWDKATWLAYARARGLNQARCMRQVKEIAQRLGVPVPSDLGAWDDARISEELRAWIDEHGDTA